ncbi:MAG: hypothetical protein IPN85_18680 [Flavobacteriales bacterium]|nr:hypothetical protein [Flavobacteriales bacterium]
MVVTVNPLPVVNAGADVAICAGSNTNLGGTPTGPSGSTYQWSPRAGLNNSTANPSRAARAHHYPTPCWSPMGTNAVLR